MYMCAKHLSRSLSARPQAVPQNGQILGWNRDTSESTCGDSSTNICGCLQLEEEEGEGCSRQCQNKARYCILYIL